VKANLLPFVLWIEASLLAIAFIGTRPYVGLGIAVVGGVVLGWVGIAGYSSARKGATVLEGKANSGSLPNSSSAAGEAVVRAGAGIVEARGTAAGLGARARQVAGWVAGHEVWLLTAPVPLLLFPNRLSRLGLILIALLWLIRWVARGHITVRTPVDVPIIGLLVMIPMALYASVDLAMSRVTLYQILAGVALFYGLANTLRSERDVGQMAFWLVLGGGGLALISPLGTTWKSGRLFNLPSIYRAFRTVLPDMINANVLAGALVLIIPIGISLLLQPRWSNSARPGSPDPGPKRGFSTCPEPGRRNPLKAFLGDPLRLAVGLAVVLIVAITALTQSRGAYVALAVGMLVFAIAVNRCFLVLGLAAVLGLVAAVQLAGMETVGEVLLTIDALGGWAVREEIWSRAIYVTQDFPYTGVGLGTFGKVVSILYPLFLVGPDVDVGHAHNLFLQVAVDLGLPGLVAFVGLLSGSLMAAWKAYRTYGARKEAGPRGLALGLLISLVIVGLHGLTDAVTWGTKPAIIPWLVMGLAVGLYRTSSGDDRGRMDEGRGALDRKKELKYN